MILQLKDRDTRRPLRSAMAVVMGLAVTTWLVESVAWAGPAINQFEVKDLDSSPGDFEFQSQNAYSTGQPRRRVIDDGGGDLSFDDNTVIRQREALEIQVGITDWFRVRVGIEYEQERLDDPDAFADANRFGDLELDEVAFEGVVIFIKPKDKAIGLGLLVEYGLPVSGEAEAQSELYVGPIIEAHTGPWSMIANLALVKFIGGRAEAGDTDFVRDERWDFSYFLQTKYEFSRSISLALEAYGTFERLGDSGRRSSEAELFGDINQHRAGLIGYYTFFPTGGGGKQLTRGGAEASPKYGSGVGLGDDDENGERELAVSVGAGVLFGLNENTPDETYKLSLEVEY